MAIHNRKPAVRMQITLPFDAAEMLDLAAEKASVSRSGYLLRLLVTSERGAYMALGAKAFQQGEQAGPEDDMPEVDWTMKHVGQG